ncbi:MAG: HPr family phosphocarrier protein [Candidatus Omnitrophica bacterium]|nr:HPr family phosphocarrier protein [Candidatus Omnitrophota bacterium]
MLIEKKLTIQNEQGLHARPAAIFVQIANKYESDIVVKKGAQEVNGKSIMGLLTLAAEKGAKLSIKANGHDAKEAIADLEKVILGDMP